MHPALAFLGGILTPSLSITDVAARLRPAPIARAMPTQAAIAGLQRPRGALVGGLSGRSGSEADYPDEQSSGNAALGAPLATVNSGLQRRVPMPFHWYLPNLPDGPGSSNNFTNGAPLVEGRGTGYNTGAYDKGWVRLRVGGGRSWGMTTRDRAPNYQTATLLPPLARAPAPADMAAEFASTNKGRTRLTDIFGD